MALNKGITLASGLNVPTAYWRVERFSGNLNGVVIELIGYKSKADHVARRASIKHVDFKMPFDATPSKNLVQQAYIFIKTQPDWTAATDA